MLVFKGKVIAGGRIALPAEVRRAMGLVDGDTVCFELEGDELRLRSAKSALRRIQAKLRAYGSDPTLAPGELVAERRAEAASE
jgi:AbrB family looped-hinge helix DNA binding protein